VSELAALSRALDLARRGRLYPAVIVHGGSLATRREAAAELARTLLCERDAAERPCGDCRHCRRIDAAPKPAAFHPDFAVLERDLKTATSAEATRQFLAVAHSAPFEARGQVFVVAEADTLSAEAGDALLKLLEEPGLGSPRHFFLLAPSRLDLGATLRSRSMALFLGAAESVPEETVAELAAAFSAAAARFAGSGSALFLLEAAARLGDQEAPEPPGGKGGKKEKKSAFDDPRAEAPWIAAAAAVRRAADAAGLPVAWRRPLFELADDLLGEAPALRLRGIPADRILEGLVSRRLAG
jgi:hypothetical protein